MRPFAEQKAKIREGQKKNAEAKRKREAEEARRAAGKAGKTGNDSQSGGNA